MTREQFLDLLHDPSGLDRHSEADLALLSSRFPYCQPLHYLHLRKLSDEQSVHYPQHLKMAAAVAPDRKQLYQFLHPENRQGLEVEIIEPERLIEMPETLSITEEPEETAISASAYEENPIAEPLDAKVTELPEPAISANDILEQRLRELNLWQEEEQPTNRLVEENPVSSLPIGETEQEPYSPEVKESRDLNWQELEPEPEPEGMEAVAELDSGPSVIITEPPQEPSNPEPEIKENRFSAPATEIKLPEEAPSAHSSFTESVQRDPLEDLIREELVQTRLRNSDYFAEQGIDTENSTYTQKQAVSAEALNTISEDVVKSKPTVRVAHSVTPEPEVKAAAITEVKQDRGSHSFLDWLQRTRNSPTELRAENVPIVDSTEERPAPAATNPEDVKELTAIPPPSSTIASPKADSGQGQVFNFSPPRTIYVRKSKIQPESRENEAVVPISAPERPTAESEALSPAYRDEENTFASSELSDENDEPALPVRKPLADPESVLNDPPRPKVPVSQLIDEFIRQEPRITPNKSAFYSPVNMAKKSVQEPEDLVTETLAKVYAGQGNYAKAIQIYEKLRLKFPEKKLYFAALIQELKDNSNP